MLIIFLILTLFWVGFIFVNSAQTGVESGEASSGVVEFVEGFFDALGFDVSVSEHFIRKLAHFCEYMLLSLLFCADITLWLKEQIEKKGGVFLYFIAPALSFFVATVDEFVIQASTVGRGPSFKDVCIDTSGALFGAIAFVLVIYLIQKLKKRSA